jgi:hypothetical protein
LRLIGRWVAPLDATDPKVILMSTPEQNRIAVSRGQEPTDSA